MKHIVYLMYREDPEQPNNVYIVAKGKNCETITQFKYAHGDRTENLKYFD